MELAASVQDPDVAIININSAEQMSSIASTQENIVTDSAAGKKKIFG
jgi:hypothetical protein